jgi:hypothetical protein
MWTDYLGCDREGTNIINPRDDTRLTALLFDPTNFNETNGASTWGVTRRVGMGLSKYSLIVGLLSDSGIELPIVGYFSRIVGFLIWIVGFSSQ